MKAREVMKFLRISRTTLFNYTKNNVLKFVKLSNGYYDYDENSVMVFMKKDFRLSVIYSRVSTHKQRDSLISQIKKVKTYCSLNDIKIDKVYSEIASGTHLD